MALVQCAGHSHMGCIRCITYLHSSAVVLYFHTPQDRCFPVHLLKSRTQLSLCIATAANAAAAFCMIYFIPIYFQFVHGDKALRAAVRLLPYIAVNVSTNLATGRFLPRIQYYMPVYLISGLFTVIVSTLFMVYLKPSIQQGVIYGLMVILGVGTGMTFSLGFSIASIMAGPSDVGRAISLQNVCRLGGSTITLVIAGQIFQSCAMANLEKVLAGEGFAADEIRGAVAGAQSLILRAPRSFKSRSNKCYHRRYTAHFCPRRCWWRCACLGRN